MRSQIAAAAANPGQWCPENSERIPEEEPSRQSRRLANRLYRQMLSPGETFSFWRRNGSNLCNAHGNKCQCDQEDKSEFDATPPPLVSCKHYKLRVQVVAPCCGMVTPCRYCHDEKADHKMDRYSIREMVCAVCSTRQPASETCTTCKTPVSSYFCGECNLFDDEAKEKKIFHCDKCGLCRVGGRENFFHCDTCGMCYSKELEGKHQCVERAGDHNCPVCLEYLFDSREPTRVMPCGHTMHQHCFLDYLNAGHYTCPECSCSIVAMDSYFEQLREERDSTPMPAGTDVPTAYMCQDCRHQGSRAFHVVGLECEKCSSFNTRRL